ncbi:MAG TPA: ferredoxin [Candidatus Lustribacter sp.]|jgi:glyoxylase-like metal-dependent hydrolase (beta-lactamase superfamily II)|nr:ferredoxin [Candidatus Lustribacter sp.]
MSTSVDRSEWTITSTCRRCRAAWNLAPGIIGANADGKAKFNRQPANEEETLAAWRAALACPTGSILAPHGLKVPDHVFPQELAPNLYRLGYNDNDTAGAHPFFIRSSTGLNLLIDGPRYVPKLVEFFEAQGGLDHVLLTHRDDVGASAKYAERFGARLWIHENDRSASPQATDILTGYAVTEPIPGVTVIPIPGHTIGSVAFLVDERLFVGDSLSWELDKLALWTNPLRCWDDWDMQRRSLKRLRDVRFTFMLAGHGGSIGLPHERMQAELAGCLTEIDKLGWQQLTHLPTGDPVPDEWHDIWTNDVPRAKADFFAAVGPVA